ncbi:hypothetical protein EZV73_08120 [Acidaminobacter sp. JC074]|uniref:hypothetical protein n=1 Tax=Acidaminobacter sp. JC074 TaxID=2530199 RepID=UPI001F0D1E50|nr:hypothetical protein [Acidaminobacter sp. JC074]MCH4887534.1 hypothetical protein [Acidaminobacter sp. JC074]
MEITIEVFGHREDVPASCEYGPSVTMGEMFDDFMDKLMLNELYEFIDLTFVEYSELLEEHDYAKEAYERGLQLPIVAIDGKVYYHSTIPYNQILETLNMKFKVEKKAS